MDERVRMWLESYVAMMRANLGPLANSGIPGLYDGIINRVFEVEEYLRAPVSASREPT